MLLRRSNQFADVFRMENKADQQSFQHEKGKDLQCMYETGRTV